MCNRRFFNADWRVFDWDEEAMKASEEKGEGIDGKGLFVLKEWKETEERGGGMGRSETGWYGIEDNDFPPEVEEEQTREIPEEA